MINSAKYGVALSIGTAAPGIRWRSTRATTEGPGRPLLRRGHAALRRFGLRFDALLLKPNTVVLLGPVDVDRAVPHRFKGAFHSDCADIDVSQHGGDEQHRDD